MSTTSRTLVVLVFLFGLSVPATASGGEPEWDESWPEFRVVEGVGTGVLFAGGAVTKWVVGPPTRPNWRGPVLFDEPIRDVLRADTDAARAAFGGTSDLLLGTLIAYPFAIDAGVFAFGIERERKLAVQMALIGAESFAVASFTTALTKWLVARERPYSPRCARGGGACPEDRYESFPSGHTSISVTGASYICAIHESIDLYGGGFVERVPCWSAIGLAAATGIFRIASDNHYASDVAAGAVIGVASGYFLPKLLHFGFGSSTTRKTAGGLEPLVSSPGFSAPTIRLTIPLHRFVSP